MKEQTYVACALYVLDHNNGSGWVNHFRAKSICEYAGWLADGKIAWRLPPPTTALKNTFQFHAICLITTRALERRPRVSASLVSHDTNSTDSNGAAMALSDRAN